MVPFLGGVALRHAGAPGMGLPTRSQGSRTFFPFPETRAGRKAAEVAMNAAARGARI